MFGVPMQRFQQGAENAQLCGFATGGEYLCKPKQHQVLDRVIEGFGQNDNGNCDPNTKPVCDLKKNVLMCDLGVSTVKGKFDQPGVWRCLPLPDSGGSVVSQKQP